MADAPAASTDPATTTHGPNPFDVCVEPAEATLAVSSAARSGVMCSKPATKGGPFSANVARTVVRSACVYCHPVSPATTAAPTARTSRLACSIGTSQIDEARAAMITTSASMKMS